MTMRKKLSAFLTVLAVTCICAVAYGAETIHCTECGMMLDVNSPFTAKITSGEKMSYFCDIGDLFSYLKRKGAQGASIEVKDFVSNEWIDGRKAFFVRAEKKFRTPMGWGVAAFKDKDKASESGAAMDFDAMAKALK
jgi:nitrous oxide reductase accessory protein NosL